MKCPVNVQYRLSPSRARCSTSDKERTFRYSSFLPHSEPVKINLSNYRDVVCLTLSNTLKASADCQKLRQEHCTNVYYENSQTRYLSSVIN